MVGEATTRQPLGNVMRMTVEELHSYAGSRYNNSSAAAAAVSSRDALTSEAVTWKNKGNACFQKGEYEKAVELYSRSISCDPDVISALGNRSMAYLKLEKYHECVDDCTMVLEKDNGHVKSYLRRGTAKQHLGQMQGAIEDFEECIRREPYNADAIKGRQECIASYLAHGEGLQAFPKHHIALQPEDMSPAKPSPPVRSSVGTGQEPVLDTKKIQKKAYKTGIEFEKDWRGCRGNSDHQACIMESLPPDSLPALLGQCLNPKLLYQITTVILSHIAPNNVSHAVSLLTALSRTDRFSVNCMSLTSAQKKELSSLWNACDSSCSSKELASLQSLYIL